MERYGLSVYKSYGGSVFHLDGSDGPSLSWRNVAGEPLIAVSVLSPSVFDNILSIGGTPSTDYCYQLPYAGLYEIYINPTRYAEFYSVFNETYSVLLDQSSILIDRWTDSAFATAQANSPLTVSVSSRYQYNQLGAAVDRLEIAIDILEQVINDGVIPGFGLVFNRNLYKGNKAQLGVGTTYLNGEDRWLNHCLFGTVPQGAQSDAQRLSVENIAGETLINLKAKVVGRYAVRQTASNKPLCYIDQSEEATTNVVSPFTTTVIRLDDIDSVHHFSKVHADWDYYDLWGFPESVFIEAESVISATGTDKYFFGSDAPCAGLVFAVHPEATTTDEASVFLNNGDDVFELALAGGSYTKSELTLADSVDDGETVQIDVRAAPETTALMDDDYDTEGLLQITAEYSVLEDAVEVVTNTLDSTASLSHKAIRLIIPALGYKASQIRFQFSSALGRLKIEEAWFGARSGLTENMRISPAKQQVTFSDETTLEYITTTTTWSDWLDFEMAGGFDHILAYEGPLVGCPSTNAGTSYYKDQGEDSSHHVVEGYTESSVHYDVVAVEIKTRNEAVIHIPLACTVPRSIAGASLQFDAIDLDLKSALDEYGITLEYVS